MPIILWLISEDAFARSLKASADKLTQDATQIAMALTIFGIVVAGVSLALGRQDGATKMTGALLGTCVVFLAVNISSFIKGIA